jgi:hypothetical protein
MTATQPTSQTQTAAADAPVVAPAAPQAPAPQTPPQNPSDPIVEVGGTTYHLRGLTVENANRIYAALPTEYQTLADHYATVAKAYETALRINLPPGITASQALRELLNAPRNAEGMLDRALLASKPYLGELQTQLGQTMPGGVTNMVNDVTNTTNFIDGVLSAVDSTMRAPGRLLDAGRTAVDEVVQAVTPGITDDQAKAFGTAFAASLFYEGAMRQNMDMFGINPFAQQRTLFWSHLPEATAAGFEYATLHWPLVKDVWPFIEAAWKFGGQWIGHMLDNTKPSPNFDTILAEVQENVATRQQTGDSSWRGLTESRLRDHDRVAAGQRVTSAENIAGVDTADRAGIIANGGAMITQDGIARTVTPTAGGGVEIETPVGPTGQPVTRMDRVGQALTGGPVSEHATGVAAIAGTASTIAVGYGAAEGFARQTMGGQAVAARGARLDARATKLETQASTLTTRADALEGGARRMPLERTPEQMRTAATTASEKAGALRGVAEPHNTLGASRAGAFRSTNIGFQPYTVPFGEMAARSTAVANEANGLHKAFNWALNAPRNLGRVIGDVGGRATDTVLHHSAQLVRALPFGLGEKALQFGGRALEHAAPVTRVAGRALAPIGAGIGIIENVDSIGIGQERDVHDRIRGGVSLTAILAAGGAAAVPAATAGAAGGAIFGFGIGAVPAGIVGGFLGFCAGASTAALATWGGGFVYDQLDSDYQARQRQRLQPVAGNHDDAAALNALHREAAASTQRTQQLASGADARRAAGTIDRAQTAAAATPPSGLPRGATPALNIG